MTILISKFWRKESRRIERLSKGNEEAKKILTVFASIVPVEANRDFKLLKKFKIYGEDIVKLYEDGSQSNYDVLREVFFSLRSGDLTRREVDRFLNRK